MPTAKKPATKSTAIIAADSSRELVPQMLRLDPKLDKRLVSKYQTQFDETLDNLAHDLFVKVGDGRLEQMMCERLALLYVVLRHREAQGIGEVNVDATGPDVIEPGFVDLAEYMSFNKLWFDLAARLQKAEATAVETNRALANLKEELFEAFENIIRETVEELGYDRADQKSVKDLVSEKMDKVWMGGGSHRTRG